ncbi:MAG: tripartite tricarboxylate transporter permease [Verrucomicrobia bacterium]|nr:tripartite tricarboxylate transporter permease [Verrucomicrobiota bacterium]
MMALYVVLATIVGTVLSSALSILPGLHAYNVLGLLVLLIISLGEAGLNLPPEVYLPFMMGMIVGWSMLNTIPAILLGAPDESALFTVLPGQKYLMSGRGYEGTMMTAVGGLGGLFFLVFIMGPFAPTVIPVVQDVLRPHMHWVLWVIITYILMSEWPKGGTTGISGWPKFFDAWKSLGAGLLTFFLSGLLGFIILYRPMVDVEVAFQNIMPAFVGLFAIPWCLLNVVSGASVPKQFVSKSLEVNGDVILRSVGAGGLGGGFAAFFPVVTGGVGGLLAGHATAQRDERVFIMSQGVSKVVYYVGAFLILFVPTVSVKRGGAAWMIQALHMPQGYGEYYMILASVAIAGCVAFLMMSPLTRATVWLIQKYNYRYVSFIAFLIIVALVYVVVGWEGLVIAAVATGIGLIPVLYGSRRLNCLGVLLLPIACNMSGVGQHIASFLRLI